MKKSTLKKIGGPGYRKSGKCTVCGRSFKKVAFGHHFKTSWGSIDACDLCAEDLYKTVMADVAGGIFSLKRDIEELRAILNKTNKNRKIKTAC